MRNRILHIDDEPAIASALRVRLEAAGFEVIHAPDGASGLAAAAQRRPDLIVLDIRMPGIDGYEVCRRVKADPQLAEVPVIFLTANTQDEARHRALEAGGVDLISKPFDAKQVLATIRIALGGDTGSELAALDQEPGSNRR